MVCTLTLQILGFTTGSEKVCCNEANAAAETQGELKQRSVDKSLGCWTMLLPWTAHCLLCRGTVNNLHSQQWLKKLPLNHNRHKHLSHAMTTMTVCNRFRCPQNSSLTSSKWEVSSVLELGIQSGMSPPTLPWHWDWKQKDLHSQGWTECSILPWLTLQQEVWETLILISAGEPLSRWGLQHVRGWRQQGSLVMSLVGGTGTVRHTILLLTALALNEAGCALLRGTN